MMKHLLDEKKKKNNVANLSEFSTSKKQIILRAPTNAAIDELVLKLSKKLS